MTLMLLEWVFTATFLILTVLALRSALGKRISARLRYALWAVVLVRLLVPVQLFTSPLAGTWVITEQRTEQNVYTPVSREEQFHPDGPSAVVNTGADEGEGPVLTVPDAPTLPDAPNSPAAPDLTRAPAWLGWLWLGGGAAAALVMLGSNLRFARRLRRCRARLEGADCPLPVYVAVGLPSPCLFGLARPGVYVTPETAANPDMLRHVIAHEYTHFRHGDHLWSLLRCGALAAHWWNPLVWLAVSLSRRDGELACDEGALRRLGDGERAAYGNTLLTLVTAKPRPGDLLCFATTMAGDKKSLKERITRIAAAPKRWMWAAVAVVLATALACVCAFGQKAEEEPSGDPDPDPSPSASQAPAEGWSVEGDDVEIAFTHTGTNPLSSFLVPEDVLEGARRWVAGEFAWDAPGGVMTGVWKEYNQETGEWDTQGDPDSRAEFDRARIKSMGGPAPYTLGNVEYELWNISYEYHTTTPEAVRADKFLLMGPGRYLDEEGWMGMYYPGCTYLIFKVNGDGSYSYAGVVYSNDQGMPAVPDGEAIRNALYPEPERGQPPEGAFDHAATVVLYEPDFNRNGIPETVKVADIPGDYVGPPGQSEGQRIGVFENGELLWWDEGYYAHAGYNAIYTCSLDGKEYLLRYNPVMYQGEAEYSYKLFYLQDGREVAVEEDYVAFDINVDNPRFAGNFDPEAIDTFMAKINHLLYFSTVHLMTDDYLLDGIENGDGLTDQLWWLDSWAPVFVRDENKTLYGNLCAYLAAMEPYGIPTVRALDGENGILQLSYHGQRKQFRAVWDQWFQPDPGAQVADLNGDGKDEIVVILNQGHGTGACEYGLYVFDGETLGQYGTDTLTQDIIDQFQCTGDEDNFYLSGPGLELAVISKNALGDVPPLADELSMGDIVYYRLEDGKIVCTLGCDASGASLLYCGHLQVRLEFKDNGFQIAGSSFVMDEEYAPSPWAPFRKVMLGEETFTLAQGGEGAQTKKYLSGFAAPTQFATVELLSGEQVVVIKDVQANGAEGYLFLYQRGGEVYGVSPLYIGSPSSNGCRVDLKTDGTLVLNAGPGRDGETWSINTEQGCFQRETAHDPNPERPIEEFSVNGVFSTGEEYRAAMEKAEAKTDAVWFRFWEEAINNRLS